MVNLCPTLEEVTPLESVGTLGELGYPWRVGVLLEGVGELKAEGWSGALGPFFQPGLLAKVEEGGGDTQERVGDAEKDEIDFVIG